MLEDRISVMREVGFILCHVCALQWLLVYLLLTEISFIISQSFGGSFQGFIDYFQRSYDGKGTALQLVQMVTDTFPSFRDETWYEGKRGKS